MRILAVLALASVPVSAQCLMAEFPPAADVALSLHSDTLVRSHPSTFGFFASAEVSALQSGTWVPTDTLVGWSVSCVEAGFGFSVALSETLGGEEVLAVSAPWDDKYGPGTGSVVLWEYGVDGYWGYTVHLLAPSPIAGGLFGYSIAVDQEFLAIGSPGDGNGAVDIYVRIGGFWTHTAHVVSPAGAAQGFGETLVVAGQSIAVLTDNAAYVYGYTGQLVHTAVPSTGAPYDSMDMDGGVLIMGSSTTGTVTAFKDWGDTEIQTLAIGVSIAGCAIGGPGLLVSAADGLHVYGPGGDVEGWAESAKVHDTGVLDATYDRFALSDATGTRLYSFTPSECYGKYTRAPLPTGKHP